MPSRPRNALPLPPRVVPDPGPNGITRPNLARSGALPRLDVNAAIAPAMGMAAIGEGVQKLGAAGSALAEKVAEAESLDGQRKAAEVMEAGQANLRIALSEVQNEPGKWGEITAQHLDETQSELAKLELDPDTRKLVDHKFQMNRTDVTGAVGSRANTKKLEMGTEALLDAMDRAGATKDRKLFDEMLKIATAGPNPFLTPGQAYKRILKYEDDVKRVDAKEKVVKYDQHQNNVVQMASSMPLTEVQKLMGMPGFAKGLDAADHERLRNVAQQVSRDRSAEVMTTVADGIADGTIKSAADINAIDSPFLTASMRQDKIDMLKTFDAQKARAAREGPEGQKAFVTSYIEARNWTPDMSKPEEAGRELADKIQWVRNNVRDDLQGEVTMVLHAKFGANAPKDKEGKTRPEIQKNISESLDIAYDPFKGVIPWKFSEPKLDAKGKPITDTHGNVVMDTREDLALKQKALDAQTAIMLEMSNWYRDNPADAQDINKVKAKFAETLPVGTRKAATDAMRSLMAPKATTPVGALNDDVINAVKGFESFIPEAYGDFKQHSVGYGTRAKSETEVLTEKEADARLREELGMHAGRVDAAAAKRGWKLTTGQRNALISFDFNTGRGADLLETSPDLADVKRRIALYTKAGKEKTELPGLVSRRKREIEIFDAL